MLSDLERGLSSTDVLAMLQAIARGESGQLSVTVQAPAQRVRLPCIDLLTVADRLLDR
jgi:hypothetical protein